MLKKLLAWFSGEKVADPVVVMPPDPEAEALLDRARAEYETGRLDAAAQRAREALERRHDLADAHLLLGRVYRKQRRPEDAADCFQLAVCFDPALAEADFSLALLAFDRGDPEEAEHYLRRALERRPDYADAHVNLGKLLLDRADYEGARDHFVQALQAEPQQPLALSNLGFTLLEGFDNPQEALDLLTQALEVAPRLADAHCNLGMVLQYLGRCEESVAASDRALELEPGMVPARLNRALALLMMGDFERGWPEYEVRKQTHKSLQRPFPFAEWHGEPLAGKTIFVQAEQGLGDEIMFASCLPDLQRSAGHCVIECNRKLEKIFARSFPGATVVGADQGSDDLRWIDEVPRADYRVAIGSLPIWFRRSEAAFPNHTGYLKADPHRVDHWRGRLEALGPGLKVGLSWRGGSRRSRQVYRSVALDDLLPLLRVSPAHFVSLQYTDCTAEIETAYARHGVKVHYWQDAIDDYDETAALVCALDQVISVQTAIVHLAGALGQRVWALVPAAPEWRYEREGERLPWYPSLRMFRQKTLGDWGDVISAVTRELEARR